MAGPTQGQNKKKNWEHSRYSDWRPSYRENPETAYGSGGSGGGGGRGPRKRRRSITGRLLRFVIAVALLLLLIGPGGDFVNGMAKAPEGACAVQVVVDGDTVQSGCPDGTDLPRQVAGYVAPDLLSFGCRAETRAGLMAALDLRKALYSADSVEVRGPGAAPVAVPEAEPAPEAGDAVPEADAAADAGDGAGDGAGADEAADAAGPVQEPSAAAGPGEVRLLVDGVDVAEVMLAAGHVRAPGGPDWCE